MAHSRTTPDPQENPSTPRPLRADSPAALQRFQHIIQNADAQHMRRALAPTDVDPQHPWRVRRGRKTLINLASNDYLGLSHHPLVMDAAHQAIEALGVGAGASQLVTGYQPIHDRVAADFAAWKHADAAVILPTGYMANLAVLTSLVEPGDLVCMDKLNHASLIDAGQAARARGADLRIHPHLKRDKLARLLDRHAARQPDAARFIVTDAVFSMDGDAAPLTDIARLARRYDAILIVDEAHSTGLLGPTGAGLVEALGLVEQLGDRLITVSTASKALGVLGGVVSASTAVIELLIQRSRPLIYTTAPPAMQAAAIGAAVDIARNQPDRRTRVNAISRRITHAAAHAGWTLPPGKFDPPADQVPILPLIVGQPDAACALAEKLADAGFLAPAIRPPTVAHGSCRVRLSFRADLPDDAVDQLESFLRTNAPASPRTAGA